MTLAQSRYVSQLTRESMAIILAGGKGTRLFELTQNRAKPALHFGGKFRIIDFPLSNCIHSGIRRIGVVTQYKAHSLLRHLVAGWGHFNRDLGEFVELLPASQQFSPNWYQGTADALFQNRDFIYAENPKYVLVLSGDQVYRMDYGAILAEHAENHADLSVACIDVTCKEAAGQLGVMAVTPQNRVIGFEEKPAAPIPLFNDNSRCLASMGIYVFNTDFLLDLLSQDALDNSSEHDFGKNIIPGCIHSAKVHAYRFSQQQRLPGDHGIAGYWRDVGTLDNFWLANMELAGEKPCIDLYDEDWPIWTYQKQSPPAQFMRGDNAQQGIATETLVSGGCVIKGAKVHQSLLFNNVKICQNSEIHNSVLLPNVHVGEGVRIRRAIIDGNSDVPNGLNIGFDRELDLARGFRVTENGIVLVNQEMLKDLAIETSGDIEHVSPQKRAKHIVPGQRLND